MASKMMTGGGTEVTDELGGQVESDDGELTVAFMPGSIDSTGTSSMYVDSERITFSSGDPRASRNGMPLAYTYLLTATHSVSGETVEQFAKDATLMFKVDDEELETAGVEGSLRVYRYDEELGQWETVPSSWDEGTGQLIAFTPHFSTYSVGAAWEKIANYIPSVNSFEVDLQSGTASASYPINIPAGPGGLGPKVSLSYNSGNIDRVDVSQQGSSSVGWGWSLSTSYIAASQKHFFSGGGYHPWTASIVAEGMSGDLVLGKDGWWHTSNESFAKITYTAGANGNRSDDKWEAWDTAGTHYVFDQNVLDCDIDNGRHASTGTAACPYDGNQDLTTYKWMLSSVTDIHGNTVTYSYTFESDQGNYTNTPSTTRRTRAVYPYLIEYGGVDNTDPLRPNRSKLKVQFSTDTRTDISNNDRQSQGGVEKGNYQSKRVNRIDVWRLLEAGSTCPSWGCDSNGYVRLRAYALEQNHGIVLTDSQNHQFSHLSLNAVKPLGADNTTQLPETRFVYATTQFAPEDKGHLYQAHNGYGGEVRFYYDAAGGDVWFNKSIRRVRAKRILDGTNASITPVSGESLPWNALYQYDYKGATTNDKHISDEVRVPPTPRFHSADGEVRGYAWVREQDPSGQVTDHYYAQDDTFKAKEWRVQAGKEYTFTDAISATPNPTPWTAVSVDTITDPENGANTVWRLFAGDSIARNSAGVADGSDVSVRLRVNTVDEDEEDYNYGGYYRLESPNGTGGTDYFGIEIYKDCCLNVGNQFSVKVAWSIAGSAGVRDLSARASGTQTLLPHPKDFFKRNRWYRLTLHTSPDGRFALELHKEDYYAGTTNSMFQDYVMIKSGDLKDSGGYIPSFPTGRTWKFKHAVTLSPDNYGSMIDSYTETRAVYSQSDSYYENQTQSTLRSAEPYSATQPLIGIANNLNGMSIRYVPITGTVNTRFKWDTWEGTQGNQTKQYRRTKTTYEYDAMYGVQLAQRNWGDVDVTGDETTSFATYVHNTSSWIIGKPQYNRTYFGHPSDVENNGYLLAKSINYYDGSTDPAATPSKGNLTKVTQVGVLNATPLPTTTVSQQFGYDTSTGNQTSVTDPRGNTTSTGFDDYYHSFPVTTTFPNTSKQYVGYDFTIDSVSAITDVNGTVTKSLYDVFGRPSRSWVVGFGTSTPVAAANEVYGFTDLGQATVTPPFYISYTVKLQDETGANSHTFGMRWFDGRGRVIQDITPKDGSNVTVVDTFYNINSQVVTASLPYGRSTSNPRVYATPDTSKDKITKLYDGIGRTRTITNPDDTTLRYDYYLQLVAEGNETETRIKYTASDTLGRTSQVFVEDPSNQVPDLKVDYGYDLLNRLTYTVRDAGGSNQTYSTIEYDALGRKSEMTDPDMGTWQYEYDAAGNLTEQRDALYLSNSTLYASHQISFTYDVMNRIKAKYYGQAHWDAGIPDVKYYYDNDLGDASTAESWGKLRAAEVTVQGQGLEKANVHRYSYDARGLLISEVITTGMTTRSYTTNYTYDDAGRLYRTTMPDPETSHEVVTNFYNSQGMGLPYSLSTNKDASAKPVYSATYNARGQLTQLLQGGTPYNNTISTTYTYDDGSTKRGWLENTSVSLGGSQSEVLDLTLDYSANGNIESVIQSATAGSNNPTFTNSYTYDAMDRLETASSTCASCPGGELFADEEYTFDSLSRMTYREINGTLNSIPYNNSAHKDAPTAYLNNSYTYDAAGNQTDRTIANGGGTQTRAFDAENRVVQIVSDTTVTDMVYDANGARIFRNITTPSTSNSLKAEYFNNSDLTSLALTRYDSIINFDWGNGTPDALIGVDTFSVRWTGLVRATSSGTYTFHTLSDDGVRLWVNGTQIINNWTDHGPTTDTGTITLTGGQWYDIKLEYYENGQGAVLKLYWTAPGGTKMLMPPQQLTPYGLLKGEYYDNSDFTSLALTRYDAGVDFNWGSGSPHGSMGSDTFSVRWTGRVKASSTGWHTFYTMSDDGVRLWVNGTQLINNWTDHAPTQDSGNINLTGGQWYDIKLEYYENGQGAEIDLQWEVPGGFDTPTPIPLDRLTTPGDATQRTLYAGGYEEEVTNQANPPYTVYYAFGGKLVSMRRANYPTTGSNGQFRIVGDYLGSTTLVVDTATPPNVVQRQYHKPYGETAWQYTSTTTGGESLTNVGYTGQRTDEESTGLVFYNARMYDPVVGVFASADTVAPDQSEPKSRNRYSYVINNPLRYNDPTGHCENDPSRASDEATRHETCENYASRLRRFGFTLHLDEWSLHELEWILEAINDLLATANLGADDYEGFKTLMGLEAGQEINLVFAEKTGDGDRDRCGPACAQPRDGGYQLWLDREQMMDWHKDQGTTDYKRFFKYVVVHELAHIMDQLSDYKYSSEMNSRASYGDDGDQHSRNHKSRPVSRRGADSAEEDWAEAVASEVYPGLKISPRHGSHYYVPNGTQPRSKYVREVLNKGRCTLGRC